METTMTGSRIAHTLLAATAALWIAGPASAQQPGGTQQQGGSQARPQSATSAPTHAATLVDTNGNRVGSVTVAQYPAGVFIHGELQGLPPGWHGFHIHEKGACSPGFDAAGGHYNPGGAKHGLNESPMHAGDLPNIHVHGDGSARFEFVTQQVSIGGGAADLMDQDGSSFVIHSGPDDYVTNPAGNSGTRIACGVIK